MEQVVQNLGDRYGDGSEEAEATTDKGCEAAGECEAVRAGKGGRGYDLAEE